MKKAILILIIILAGNYAFSQDYIVTYLKGNVYHDHKVVKLHDRLNGINELTSDDRSSELALFSAQKGKFRLSFQTSKPVVANSAEKKSELFELIVGSYIKAYTTEKALTTRGDFDLKLFFNPLATDTAAKQIYLIESESLPAKSKLASLHMDDQFMICTEIGNDTSCMPVKRTINYLVFDQLPDKTFKQADLPVKLTCTIMRGHSVDGKLQQENFCQPIVIAFLSKKYVSSLVTTYNEGLYRYYQGDRGKMLADVEEQLNYYFGRSFHPAVQKLLETFTVNK